VNNPHLTEFQIKCEGRIAEDSLVSLLSRRAIEDYEGGIMVRGQIGPAVVWIYPDGAEWSIGDEAGIFEWQDYRGHDELIESLMTDLREISATGEVPSRIHRRH